MTITGMVKGVLPWPARAVLVVVERVFGGVNPKVDSFRRKKVVFVRLAPISAGA
jgi:hypothetical protein